MEDASRRMPSRSRSSDRPALNDKTDATCDSDLSRRPEGTRDLVSGPATAGHGATHTRKANAIGRTPAARRGSCGKPRTGASVREPSAFPLTRGVGFEIAPQVGRGVRRAPIYLGLRKPARFFRIAKRKARRITWRGAQASSEGQRHHQGYHQESRQSRHRWQSPFAAR